MNSQDIIAAFADQTIMVLGDVMIDAYIWGEHTRMSPEAPVPVVDVNTRDARLGGAANVALNIASAGARPLILTVLGDKGRSAEYVKLMEDEQLDTTGLVASPERRCSVKTRVISNNKHMLRVDEEDKHPLEKAEEIALIERFEGLVTAEKVNAIILQDYNKGVLTPKVIAVVTARAKSLNIPVMVDPKKDNFSEFLDCSLFKPNLKELREGLAIDIEPTQAKLDEAIELLRDKMPHQYTMITLSEHGVYWNDGARSAIIPAFERNIVDVSGAGDTVIALAALAMASGASIDLAALIANLGGGLVCEEVGVQPIRKEQLTSQLQTLNL